MPRDAVIEQLNKILSAGSFHRTAALTRLISFAVTETLDGRADSLKEYSIGVTVFNRGSDFDPRIDPIVRVQARNLRARLDEYYNTSGSNDELLITFDKGCYVPCFQYRKTTLQARVTAPPCQH